MVRKIRQVRRKKGSKRGRPEGAPSFFYTHAAFLCIVLCALCSKKKGGPQGRHLYSLLYNLLSRKITKS